MSTYNWLVTGASSGLGAQIVLAALKAGHKVVATARNVAKAQESYPEIEKKGGSWLKLDVTSKETQTILQKAVKEHGINVVVNNAGYALRGVLEDLSETQIRDQIETNVIAPLLITQACLPFFRSQRNGTIVNISSTSGMTGNAGYSLYAASKFALEGASESLAAELASFNIRVLVIEPGGFRTNFQAAVQSTEGGVSAAYQGTPADEIAKRMSGVHGKQAGDPAKAGRLIVEAVTGAGAGGEVKGLGVLRLPLGKDAVQRTYTKIDGLKENVEKVKHVSESAVFDELLKK